MNKFFFTFFGNQRVFYGCQEPATRPYPIQNECSSFFSNPWFAFVGLVTTQFIICIRIHFICHPCDKTVAGFWNILDYHTEPVLNQVCTSNSVVLHIYLCRTTYQRSILFGCIHLLLVQWHQVPPTPLFVGEGAVQFLLVMLKDQETVGEASM